MGHLLTYQRLHAALITAAVLGAVAACATVNDRYDALPLEDKRVFQEGGCAQICGNPPYGMLSEPDLLKNDWRDAQRVYDQCMEELAGQYVALGSFPARQEWVERRCPSRPRPKAPGSAR